MESVLVTENNLEYVRSLIGCFLYLREDEDYKILICYHNFDCCVDNFIKPYGVVRFASTVKKSEITETHNIKRKTSENFIKIHLDEYYNDNNLVCVHIGDTVYLTSDRLVINSEWDSTNDFKIHNSVVLKCKNKPIPKHRNSNIPNSVLFNITLNGLSNYISRVAEELKSLDAVKLSDENYKRLEKELDMLHELLCTFKSEDNDELNEVIKDLSDNFVRIAKVLESMGK